LPAVFSVRSIAQALEKRPEDLPGEAALISVVAAGSFMEMMCPATRRALACLRPIDPDGTWQRDQLCQLSEILGGGSQQELVLSAKWTSQPEPIEA